MLTLERFAACYIYVPCRYEQALRKAKPDMVEGLGLTGANANLPADVVAIQQSRSFCALVGEMCTSARVHGCPPVYAVPKRPITPVVPQGRPNLATSGQSTQPPGTDQDWSISLPWPDFAGGTVDSSVAGILFFLSHLHPWFGPGHLSTHT